MSVVERLSMVVSITLMGLALYFIIDLPTRTFVFKLWGDPLVVTTSTRLVMVVLLGGLALSGAGAVVHSHPTGRSGYTRPFWVNAMLIVILATLLLAQTGKAIYWVGGLLTTGVVLWFTLWAEYILVKADRTRFSVAQAWSQGVSYTLMAAFAILIFQSQMSVLLKVISTALTGALLAGSILKYYTPQVGQIWGISLLTGISMGQLAWVLTFWTISSTGVGLLCLLSFYIICELISNYLQNTLVKRLFIEYAIVVGISIAIVWWLERQF